MVSADSVASETTLCFRLMLSSPDSRPRIYAWTAEHLAFWSPGGRRYRKPREARLPEQGKPVCFLLAGQIRAADFLHAATRFPRFRLVYHRVAMNMQPISLWQLFLNYPEWALVMVGY